MKRRVVLLTGREEVPFFTKFLRQCDPRIEVAHGALCDYSLTASRHAAQRRKQMASVRQLLDEKGRGVLSIGADRTVLEAIGKMAEANVGALVVIDEDGKLAGIITERHYARNVILKGRTSPETPIRDVMETRVVCAWPEQTVEECMAVMTDKAVRHLPVLDKKELVGIVSIGDLVKSIIKDQKFTIEQLERYITH
jgi:CBS domain-containing protein